MDRENKTAEILVVDDEKAIADLIEVYLKNENYRAHCFYSAAEALACLEDERIDLAVIDVMMPDMDGFTLCGEIRKKYQFPIIMLTARDGDMDKITGLTLGADDYVTKPFKPLELVARIKAQLRRYTQYNPGSAAENVDEIRLRGLTINRSSRECTVDDRPVQLTPMEFAILWTLCENRGTVVSPETLFYKVWGDKYYISSNNTVMVHIRHLREKIGDSADAPRYIKTVWGVGYLIEK